MAFVKVIDVCQFDMDKFEDGIVTFKEGIEKALKNPGKYTAQIKERSKKPIKGYVWYRRSVDGNIELYKTNYDCSD